jgi:hypothetical protein
MAPNAKSRVRAGCLAEGRGSRASFVPAEPSYLRCVVVHRQPGRFDRRDAQPRTSECWGLRSQSDGGHVCAGSEMAPAKLRAPRTNMAVLGRDEKRSSLGRCGLCLQLSAEGASPEEARVSGATSQTLAPNSVDRCSSLRTVFAAQKAAYARIGAFGPIPRSLGRFGYRGLLGSLWAAMTTCAGWGAQK